MDQDAVDAAHHFLEASKDAIAKAMADPAFVSSIVQIAAVMRDCLANGGKILLAGNGGSAADAQHFATELVVRYLRHRASFAAIALTTNGPLLTAAGNDLGFEQVFSRQVEGLGKPGDVFIAISTSGRSPNVLLAAETARKRGLTTVAFCAMTGSLAESCDLALRVPCDQTPLIQQVHMAAAHAMCLLLERSQRSAM